jgi:hypothetical protein
MKKGSLCARVSCVISFICFSNQVLHQQQIVLYCNWCPWSSFSLYAFDLRFIEILGHIQQACSSWLHVIQRNCRFKPHWRLHVIQKTWHYTIRSDTFVQAYRHALNQLLYVTYSFRFFSAAKSIPWDSTRKKGNIHWHRIIQHHQVILF